jgi:small redox-active disulfide protein 2
VACGWPVARGGFESEEFAMIIKILGTGCAKCARLEQLTREVVAELGIEASFEHVREIDQIMAYPVMTTPALVIDEEVKVAGRIPAKDELRGWLG